jgi:hypothetical protein
LNNPRAKYLLVGGYAVASHGQPRFTKDLDVWIDSTVNNADAVDSALKAIGEPLRDVTVADLTRTGLILQMGVPPNRIDLFASVDGVAFADAYESRQEAPYGDQTIRVIGRAHLIQNKRTAGRPTSEMSLDRQGLEAGRRVHKSLSWGAIRSTHSWRSSF